MKNRSLKSNTRAALIFNFVALAGCSAAPELVDGYDGGAVAMEGDELSDEDLGWIDQEVVGGTKTTARPEVGKITTVGADGKDYLLCTATLIHSRYVISASHCFPGTGPFTAKFWINNTPFGIDYVYSYGTKQVNAEDIALVRLTSNVASAVAAPVTIGASPVANAQVSTFGYGCTSRVPRVDVDYKTYVDYLFNNTATNCWGDSGGPRFHGSHTGKGSIWGVNSGFNNSTGRDVNGDVAYFGPALLRGVTSFGGAEKKQPVITDFAQISAESVKAVSGDFDADGITDVAFIGPAGWTSVPVAFGKGDGGYRVINSSPLANFPAWARTAKSVVAADFDGDGDTDIAALGVQGWSTIPIARSNRNGTFEVWNESNPTIASWAAVSGAYAVAGDFDADGDGDIALLGGTGWTTIPVATSNRNGKFGWTNEAVADFPVWSRWTGVRAVVGDFDGDRDADIALSGSASFASIPVARSNRLGGFAVVASTMKDFPGWAKASGVKFAAGDYDGDGDSDIAVVGGPGWRTVGFAIAMGGGVFQPANLPITEYPTWAVQSRYFFGGKANVGASADLILAGGSGWDRMPTVLLKP
jgi:hypothetical protein